MTTIAFFDLRLVGIRRYPLRLANEISRMDDRVKFVFFYIQADNEREVDVQALLPKNSSLVHVNATSYSYLRRLLEAHRPDKLVTMAQRIPDSAMVATAKRIGIQTFMYQHGLYVPFMKRERSLFLGQAKKTLRYAAFAKAIADARGANPLAYVTDYIRVFVKAKNVLKTRIDPQFVNVDKVLVYGEHWKAYHRAEFGYSEDQQVVVGYPDLDDIQELHQQPVKELPCYIAQTLVEDGRLERSKMLAFVESLGSAVRTLGSKIVVKLHPRSDLSLYDGIRDVAIFEPSKFPVCKLYLGHYSSVIVKGAFFTDKIVLVDFEGHEIPEYIRSLASETTQSDWDLTPVIQKALEGEISPEVVKENLEKQNHYFAYFPEGALRKAAREILR